MSLNILVVDDSDVIRAMIGRTLRLADIPMGEIFEAGNGREALQIMADEWVDLVLADINMPIMTGSEMIERMRERPETQDVPVIVVSTEGAAERVEELLGQGVAAWVRKPFAPEEIRDVINSVTSTWRPALDAADDIDVILGSVLEVFAFALPEPTCVSELPTVDDEFICATITFSGAASGTTSIAAPSQLCRELAANILGIEVDDPDAAMRGADTLGEIANITAGHIATAVDAEHHTHLNPPVVARMSRDEWEATLAAAGTRGYLVDDQPVLLSLGLRQARDC